jgi:hypothetical protein
MGFNCTLVLQYKDYYITETIAKTAIHESENKYNNMVGLRIRNKVKMSCHNVDF